MAVLGAAQYPLDRRTSVLQLTDSYKVSQWAQLPPRTTNIYSYFESRRGARYDATVFFGLQIILKEHLCGVTVTREKIDAAERLYAAHFGRATVFNRPNWEHILRAHGGRLPLRIRAVPEGTVVPIGNVMMTVENTDPECAWLTNYMETLLTQTWYTCTVATQSREMKRELSRHATADMRARGLHGALHDFGFRGTSCVGEAARGGAAHLVNFSTTDNVPALQLCQELYGADEVAGTSVPATEHSTMTSWGRGGETHAYRRMLDCNPEGVVSVVSDSWDIFHACRHIWGETLRDAVLARDGKLVVRPDSGDPATVLVRVLQILGEQFGTEDVGGRKVLNSKVGVLQGDGITADSLPSILAALDGAGWCTSNVTFGSGGGLLRKLDRDTQRFAFKCSSATVDSQRRDVFKDPVTANGSKTSKAGRLKLVDGVDGLRTVQEADAGDDVLELVYLDGELVRDQSLASVRRRVGGWGEVQA